MYSYIIIYMQTTSNPEEDSLQEKVGGGGVEEGWRRPLLQVEEGA